MPRKISLVTRRRLEHVGRLIKDFDQTVLLFNYDCQQPTSASLQTAAYRFTGLDVGLREFAGEIKHGRFPAHYNAFHEALHDRYKLLELSLTLARAGRSLKQ